MQYFIWRAILKLMTHSKLRILTLICALSSQGPAMSASGCSNRRLLFSSSRLLAATAIGFGVSVSRSSAVSLQDGLHNSSSAFGCSLDKFLGNQSEAACQLSLPKFSPDLAEREQALVSIQQAIENSRRFHSYDGVDSKEIPRGPIPTNSSLAERMIESEALDIRNRGNQNVTELVGGLLLSNQVPVETMDDLKNMYARFSPQLPVPKSLENWDSDVQFADLRRTYMGHRLERLQEPLFELELNDRQLGLLLGSDKSLSSHTLYGIDQMDVERYNANDGRRQYMPGSQAMFAATECDSFVVLGIKLSNGLVYTPFDNENEWMMAKIAFSSGEFLYTAGQHFIETHLLVEPVRTEMLRHLSKAHPVHALLAPHMKNLFGNTVAGLESLFTKDTALDQLSAWGAKGFMEYYGNQTQQGVDFSRTLEEDIKIRGLENLPDYRQASDCLALKHSIRCFVRQYLSLFYRDEQDVLVNPTKGDVREDTEVQSWARACASEEGGNVLNFPREFTNLTQLTEAVSHLIYIVAVKHHVMNSDSPWHANPFPGSSLGLWAPLPNEKGVEVSPRNFLPPTAELIASQVLITDAFRRKIEVNDSLLGLYNESSFESHISPKVQYFVNRLGEVSQMILTREDQNPDRVRFDLYNPDRLPYYIWI